MDHDKNSHNSLDDICKEHYDYIYNMCLFRLYSNEEFAYDITQETFKELCIQWDELEKNNIKSWLWGTADNKIKQLKASYKKKYDYADIESSAKAIRDVEVHEDIESVIRNDILNRNMDKNIDTIYENMKSEEIQIVEYLQQGLSQLEIAEKMNMSHGAIRMKVIRLRNKVKKIISDISDSSL